jgi:cyclophilin family peptidyl-prolyl cis-trans isomerase
MKIQEVQKVEQRDKRRQRLALLGLLVVGVAVAAYLLSLTGGGNDTTANSTTTSTSTSATANDTSGTAPTTTAAAGQSAVSAPSPGATSGGTPTCPADDGSAERTTSFAQAPPTCIDATAVYQAKFETTLGTFTADLDPKLAPAAVNNFVFLSRYHYYDGAPFHRIIKDFVIQGGDATGNPLGTGGPGYTIAEEIPQPAAGAKAYQVGSLAMAHTDAPNSTGSQFFVVTGTAGTNLPAKYSLFGQVTDGIDVVHAIEALPTTSKDFPTQEIYITSVTITEKQ